MIEGNMCKGNYSSGNELNEMISWEDLCIVLSACHYSQEQRSPCNGNCHYLVSLLMRDDQCMDCISQ